ncbi:hypothetical protein JYP52_18835 [Nitratireductor aquibiodomus]|nr:hypothetical protein [Nitratireductor aquibiodomus]MBN7763201.1 hypothetical protein [Nitratireductor aquibiodomus]
MSAAPSGYFEYVPGYQTACQKIATRQVRAFGGYCRVQDVEDVIASFSGA